jgi:hypothetical protein
LDRFGTLDQIIENFAGFLRIGDKDVVGVFVISARKYEPDARTPLRELGAGRPGLIFTYSVGVANDDDALASPHRRGAQVA